MASTWALGDLKFVVGTYMQLTSGFQARIRTVDATGRFVPLHLHEKREPIRTIRMDEDGWTNL
jgi:hypothetical protein